MTPGEHLQIKMVKKTLTSTNMNRISEPGSSSPAGLKLSRRVWERNREVLFEYRIK